MARAEEPNDLVDAARALGAHSLSQFCPYDGIVQIKEEQRQTSLQMLIKVCRAGILLATKLRAQLQGSMWTRALHHRTGSRVDGAHHLPLYVAPHVWKKRDTNARRQKDEEGIEQHDLVDFVWEPQAQIGSLFLPLLTDYRRSLADAEDPEPQTGLLERCWDALHAALAAAEKQMSDEVSTNELTDAQKMDFVNAQELISLGMRSLFHLEPYVIKLQLWNTRLVKNASDDEEMVVFNIIYRNIEKEAGKVMLATFELVRCAARAEAAVHGRELQTNLSTVSRMTDALFAGYRLSHSVKLREPSMDSAAFPWMIDTDIIPRLEETFVYFKRDSLTRISKRRNELRSTSSKLRKALELPWLLRRVDQLMGMMERQYATEKKHYKKLMKTFCVYFEGDGGKIDCKWLSPYRNLSTNMDMHQIKFCDASKVKETYRPLVAKQNEWRALWKATMGVASNVDPYMYGIEDDYLRGKNPKEHTLEPQMVFGACLELIGEAACHATPQGAPTLEFEEEQLTALPILPDLDDADALLQTARDILEDKDVQGMLSTSGRQLRGETHVKLAIDGLIEDIKACQTKRENEQVLKRAAEAAEQRAAAQNEAKK